MRTSLRRKSAGAACSVGAATLGVLLAATLPAKAQVSAGAVDRTVDRVGTTATTTGNVLGQAGQTIGQVGATAGNVVGGLQPTLQPVGQGLGNALTNLTQPDTVSALLEFLAGVIPNHIEAHVNLDSLRVEKLTVDVRGVDLRNLRVDLLVANSRNAGQVRPAMGPGSSMQSMPRTSPSGSGGGFGGGGFSGGSGSFGGSNDSDSAAQPAPQTSLSGSVQLPGDTSITGSSTRQR